MASPKNDEKATTVTTETKAVENAAGIAGNVVVRGPEHGRWRAGRHFGPTPQAIELCSITNDQLAAIAADPLLSVVINRD